MSAEAALPPVALRAGEGLSVANPTGSVITFKARSEQSAGSLTVIEGGAVPGEGPPLHVHMREDEFIYTLEGRFRIKLAGELIEADPGSFVFIPRGTPHTWQNIGAAPARFLAALTPATVEFEQFFLRYAELPADQRGTAAFSRLAAETQAFEVLGPPLAQSHPRPLTDEKNKESGDALREN